MKPKLIQLLLFLSILVIPLGRRHIFWSINPVVAGSWSPFASVAVFAVDFAALFVLVFAAFHWKKLKNRANTWVFGYFLWSIAVFFVLPRETLYDTYILLKTLELLVIFTVFSFVSHDRSSLRAIFWGFTISGIIQSLIAIGQFALQHSFGLGILGETTLNINIQGLAKIQTQSQLLIRPYGTLDHPNQLAAFLIVACATTLYLLISEKSRLQKTIASLCLITLSFAEFLTFSRAGIGALGILFAVFIAVYFSEQKWGHEMKALLGIIFVSLAIPISSLFPQLSSRVTLVDNATLSRLEYDKLGLQIVSDHPFVGVGPGNEIFAMAQKLPHAQSWEVQPPHNYFIDVACETGIIGLIIFLASLIYLVLKLIKRIRRKEGDTEIVLLAFGVSVLASIVFLMMFDHYFYDLPQTELLLWLILGIITGIVSRETIIQKT